MKISKYIIFLGLLFVAYLIQPWTYNYRGFDEVNLAIAGGEIRFELIDQVGHKKNKFYCLYSRFKTNDKSDEAITIRIDSIGTSTNPSMRKNIVDAGRTISGNVSPNPVSYFSTTGISKLVLTDDEVLEVKGSVFYKGVNHNFETALKLKYWEESREVIRFCA